MKLILFINNRTGAELARWLRSEGEDIALAVLHPEARRKHGDLLEKALKLDPARILDASGLKTGHCLEKIHENGVQLGIAAFFGYIVPRSVLDAVPGGIINVHPSFLPYNRGAYPNVWPIIDKTPAGVSLHYMDEGIDTGDIIAQTDVPVQSTDTGESLYGRLETASLELFQKYWPVIKNRQAVRISQDKQAGTVHLMSDVNNIDCIDLNASYKAEDLINILRARTFPPYRGAYFLNKEGKKVYLTLKLEEE